MVAGTFGYTLAHGHPRAPSPIRPSSQVRPPEPRPQEQPDLRDKGTLEAQAKRHALINGADPQLAATASGILLANGLLTQAQHVAALRYARLHALVYGKAWTVVCPLGWDLPSHGSEPSEGLLDWAERRIVELNALLTPEQRQAVANVAVFGFVPHVVLDVAPRAAAAAGGRSRPRGAAQPAWTRSPAQHRIGHEGRRPQATPCDSEVGGPGGSGAGRAERLELLGHM